MSDPISTTACRECLTDLAERFILETNAFLGRHCDEPKVWWPLKSATNHAGDGTPTYDTTVSRISAADAEELVSRLMQSCRVIRPHEGIPGNPRYAILVVVDAEQAQPVIANPLLSSDREATDRRQRPMASLQRT